MNSLDHLGSRTAGFAKLVLHVKKQSNKELNDLTMAKQPVGNTVTTPSNSPESQTAAVWGSFIIASSLAGYPMNF